MLQILETRVPRNLDTLRAISFVYGINKSTAQKICSKLGINPKVEIGKLDPEVLESITLEPTERPLHFSQSLNIILILS